MGSAARAVGAILAAAALSAGFLACGTTTAAAAEQPRLFFDCRGPVTERPTVILEAGVFGTSADWDNILRDYGATSRICAYDRAGLGASAKVSGAHNAMDNARTLARHLDEMGETRPVILVGHSNGGLYVQAFATLFPDRVAGLVYVNGVGVDDLDDPLLISSLRQEADLGRFAVVAGRLHVTGLALSPAILALELDAAAAGRKRRALTSLRHLTNGSAEAAVLVADLSVIRAAGAVPPGIPVVAVVSMPRHRTTINDAWRKAEAAPVRRACQGWILDVKGGDHVSPLARDRAYLLEALAWLATPDLADPARACTDKAYKE